MGVPQLFGGTEVNPITLLHVYQILASACASTAWCVGNHTAACRKLHEGGLLSMGVPQLFGGTEVNPITLLHVYQILASACASTAWCVGNHTAACRKLHDVMGSAAEPYLRAIASEGAIVAQGIVPTGDTRPVPRARAASLTATERVFCSRTSSPSGMFAPMGWLSLNGLSFRFFCVCLRQALSCLYRHSDRACSNIPDAFRCNTALPLWP